MRIHCKYTGIKGFLTVYNRAVRFRYMITEKAKRRLKILDHWKRHGLESARHAFDVSERTLWYWKARLDKEEGKIETLNPLRRTPQKKRKRIWDIRLLDEIKNIREKRPNLGRDKIHPLLLDFTDAFGLGKCPKPMTIGRLIKDMGGLRTTPQRITGTGKIRKINRQKVLRKPKDFVSLYPGHCLALDTIERQRNGRRMYVLTAIDIFTRTTFAITTKSHSSRTSAHFFYLVRQLFPYKIKNVLTDNGSARLLTGNLYFHQELEDKIAKFKNRPAGISFVTGYMANAGAIPPLVNVFKPSLMSLIRGKILKDKETVVFSDEFNHASIIAGVRLSKAEKEIYRHRSPTADFGTSKKI